MDFFNMCNRVNIKRAYARLKVFLDTESKEINFTNIESSEYTLDTLREMPIPEFGEGIVIQGIEGVTGIILSTHFGRFDLLVRAISDNIVVEMAHNGVSTGELSEPDITLVGFLDICLIDFKYSKKHHDANVSEILKRFHNDVNEGTVIHYPSEWSDDGKSIAGNYEEIYSEIPNLSSITFPSKYVTKIPNGGSLVLSKITEDAGVIDYVCVEDSKMRLHRCHSPFIVSSIEAMVDEIQDIFSTIANGLTINAEETISSIRNMYDYNTFPIYISANWMELFNKGNVYVITEEEEL